MEFSSSPFLVILFTKHVDHILLYLTASTSAVIAILNSIYLKEWKLKKLWKLTTVMSQIEGCFFYFWCLLAVCCFFHFCVRKCSSLFRRWNNFFGTACLLASQSQKNILIEHKELITQIMKFIQWKFIEHITLVLDVQEMHKFMWNMVKLSPWSSWEWKWETFSCSVIIKLKNSSIVT